MLFPPQVHDQVWTAYGPPSAATLARARGWAVFFGVTLAEVGLNGDVAFARIAATTLHRLAEGPE